MNHFSLNPVDDVLTVDINFGKSKDTTKVISKIEDEVYPIAHIRADDKYENLRAAYFSTLNQRPIQEMKRGIKRKSPVISITRISIDNAETTNHIEGLIGPGSLDEQEIDEVFIQRFEEHNEILIAGGNNCFLFYCILCKS